VSEPLDVNVRIWFCPLFQLIVPGAPEPALYQADAKPMVDCRTDPVNDAPPVVETLNALEPPNVFVPLDDVNAPPTVSADVLTVPVKVGEARNATV